MKKLLLTLVLLAAAVTAHAGSEVAGVKFDDRISLGNANLVLNGAGMRAKWIIRVYVVGLYAAEKKTAAADLIALAGPKRLHVVTLRELSGEQFAEALVSGIHKNLSEAEVEPLQARIEQFRTTILDLKTAAKGAVVDIDWLPDVGTRLTVDGMKRGVDIPGDDFYKALLRIWLGDRPAQNDLKDALLGKPAG
jgi:hypothetical protein